ncbi:ATP-binding protein [Uliginosibacterium sp. sgz301328]|uniref:ATP-binding protein n=1 Tax=Uliginosibacterium sp. sgz301328 TaxID=3243764 RepID=UPI00359D727E
MLARPFASPLDSRLWPAGICAADGLRLLSDLNGLPDESALATTLLESPWLSVHLLAACGASDEPPLTALRNACQRAGRDLLAAWAMLSTATLDDLSPARLAQYAGFNQHTRGVARVARALAQRSGLADPDHAYLAGLWHNLGQFVLAARHAGYPGPVTDARETTLVAGEQRQYGEHHAAVGAALARTASAIPLLPEAIELHHAPEAFMRGMPGLPRVLRAAVEAAAGNVAGVEFASRLLAITHEQARDALGAFDDGGTITLPAPGAVAFELAMTSAQGMIRAAFSEVTDTTRRERLGIACTLLCGRGAPWVMRQGEDSSLMLVSDLSVSPSPVNGVPRSDDSSGMRAADSGQRIVVAPDFAGAGADWLLARQLGATRLEFIPWHAGVAAGVAVFAHAGDVREDANDLQLLRTIVGNALGAHERARIQKLAIRTARESARHAEQQAARKVAHEVSNPLSVLGNYLSVIQREQGSAAPELARQLALMQAEIGRAQRLVKTLGQPAPAREIPGATRVNEILQDLRMLYEESLFSRRNIALQMQLAPDLPAVGVEADALRQVILNLLLNAAEAIGEHGGSVRVSSSCDLNFDDRPWVEIRVKDDGPGLPRTKDDRLELPHATSKTAPHSGVGLAVSRELVQQAGGHLLCRSREGAGTTFSILLPLAI